MNYIKSIDRDTAEALGRDNWTGPRAYYQVSYKHDSGADWCAIVEDLQYGEIRTTAEDFAQIAAANHDHNQALELAYLEDARKQAKGDVQIADLDAWIEEVRAWERPTVEGAKQAVVDIAMTVAVRDGDYAAIAQLQAAAEDAQLTEIGLSPEE